LFFVNEYLASGRSPQLYFEVFASTKLPSTDRCLPSTNPTTTHCRTICAIAARIAATLGSLSSVAISSHRGMTTIIAGSLVSVFQLSRLAEAPFLPVYELERKGVHIVKPANRYCPGQLSDYCIVSATFHPSPPLPPVPQPEKEPQLPPAPPEVLIVPLLAI